MAVTITEALAEIKTIGKRVSKKEESIRQYLIRLEALKDPLASDGGSVQFIQRERQAIKDLQERVVVLRASIARANADTDISVNGDVRTIANWLTWRREVAPGEQQFLRSLRTVIEGVRTEARQKGVGVFAAAAAVQVGDVKPNDVLVNISEHELAEESENLEEILGTLDGLLSLKNATTTI